MPQQSTSTLPRLSSEQDFRRELRRGQQDLLKAAATAFVPGSLNVKWPGGYGKSLGIAMTFRQMASRGECDRLLIVVANDTQREQILNDFRQDCRDVAMDIGKPWRVTNEPSTHRANRTGKHVVFVATIQQVSASARSGMNLIHGLMRDCGDWMLAADEYHHYAEDRDWGEALSTLVEEAKFVLATSATPYRSDKKTIFGDPDLEVSYVDARKEKAVKPIRRRRYEYRIDYIDNLGDPVQFSAEDLRNHAGGAERVSQYEAKQRLRYSSKYVLPIVSEPLFRLTERRLASGHPLQMLVRTMSCAHAKSTCDQISSITDLHVDWIGTGEDGRSDFENRKIKEAFCPKKREDGTRPAPTLDVLVQVGMADEGFDSLMVAEIVDLHIVTLEGAANKSKQFYKRGTRFIDGVELYINVGNDHPLAALESNQVEAWIDGTCSIKAIKETVAPASTDWDENWEWPEKLPGNEERLVACELTDIQVDQHPMKDPVVKLIKASRPGVDFSDGELRDLFRRALSSGHEDEEAIQLTLQQQRSVIDKTVGQLAAAAVRARGGEFEKSLIGDYKKRINKHILQRYGKRSEMLFDDLQRVYDWMRELRDEVKDGEVPVWLR